MLFYATRIDDELEKPVSIYVNHVIACVMASTRHAAKMRQAMGYSGPVLIELAMTSIRGVPWAYAFHRLHPQSMEGSLLDDDVSFQLLTTTLEIHEKPDLVARNLLRYILFAVNNPGPLSGTGNLDQLIRAGV